MSWTHKDTTKTGAYISNIQHRERKKITFSRQDKLCLLFIFCSSSYCWGPFSLHLLVQVVVIVFCAVLLLLLQFLISFYSSIFSCVLNCVPFILRLCIYIVFFLHCSSCFVAFRKCVVIYVLFCLFVLFRCSLCCIVIALCCFVIARMFSIFVHSYLLTFSTTKF